MWEKVIWTPRGESQLKSGLLRRTPRGRHCFEGATSVWERSQICKEHQGDATFWQIAKRAKNDLRSASPWCSFFVSFMLHGVWTHAFSKERQGDTPISGSENHQTITHVRADQGGPGRTRANQGEPGRTRANQGEPGEPGEPGVYF